MWLVWPPGRRPRRPPRSPPKKVWLKRTNFDAALKGSSNGNPATARDSKPPATAAWLASDNQQFGLELTLVKLLSLGRYRPDAWQPAQVPGMHPGDEPAPEEGDPQGPALLGRGASRCRHCANLPKQPLGGPLS